MWPIASLQARYHFAPASANGYFLGNKLPLRRLLDVVFGIQGLGSLRWPLRFRFGVWWLASSWRQVYAPIETAYRKPVQIYLMVASAVVLYASHADFKPAECRAALTLHGIGGVRERLFLGHAKALAALQVKRKVVVAALGEIVATYCRVHSVVVIPEMKPVQRVPGKVCDLRHDRLHADTTRHSRRGQPEGPACLACAAALCLCLWRGSRLRQSLHKFPELLPECCGEAGRP